MYNFFLIIGLFYIPLEFQPKMKNLIYHHTTGFLNYTSVLLNSVILLGLSNALRNLFPNHYSIDGQNWASELLWHWLLEGWCELDVDSEEL